MTAGFAEYDMGFRCVLNLALLGSILRGKFIWNLQK
jgi:hypothetical protein